MWNGTAAILKASPTVTRMTPRTKIGASGEAIAILARDIPIRPRMVVPVVP